MYGNVLTKDQIDSLLKTESVVDPIVEENLEWKHKDLLWATIYTGYGIFCIEKMKTTGETFEHLNKESESVFLLIQDKLNFSSSSSN